MRRTNKIIIAVILVAVMLLGIGYAAIQNITLNITGTATADPNQANFTVKFSGTPTTDKTNVSENSTGAKVTAAITDDTNATINVEGLTAKGDVVTVTYTVQNTSADLSADLTVETTNNNEEYFTITSELGKTSLTATEATTLTVTVELIKTPITASEEATIGIQLTAAPVQPGEEGSTNTGSGTGGNEDPVETTTLASVTNDNIGDYINLRNNVVGTPATTDDWRILYTDGNMVYAILADYLPNSTNYAVNAGLETMGTYGVYSNTSRDTLLTAFNTSSNWNDLANGISGAVVTGAIDEEVAFTSYYAKTGINPMETGTLDSTIEDYDLYVPHTSTINDCEGVWIDMPHKNEDAWIASLLSSGGAYYKQFDYPYLAVRPMVSIPTSTTVTVENGIWTIPLEATNGETNAGVDKEETSEPIETTLAAVTNSNIGEYIDLGNNIIGGTSTVDDWKILYVEDNKVYAILADYLANTTGYAANAGLDVSSTYSVYSNTNRDTLLNGLLTTSNWQGLANGISEEKATVTGGPTVELLMKSYKAKTGIDLDYTTYPTLERNYLYTPHADPINDCYGYWLASPNEGSTNGVREVSYDGRVISGPYNDTSHGVRPVVCLSSDINVVKNGTLWTVVK